MGNRGQTPSSRWRTRTLWFALPLLVFVAGASAWELVGDLREFAGDPKLRAITHPLWYHSSGYLRTASRFALLFAVLGALFLRSAAALRSCWLAALALYVLPALIPGSWFFRPEVLANPDPDIQAVLAAAAPAFALASCIDLLPLAPSLCVGLSRAGACVVRLEPRARSTGTLAVFVAALILTSVLAVPLAFAMPLVHEPTLVTGLGLMVAHYVLVAIASALLLARPTRRGLRRLMTGSALVLLLPGLALFLWGLQHVEVLGQHLVQWGTTEGVLAPLTVVTHGIEFAGRSALTAVAILDVVLLGAGRSEPT